MSAWIAWRLIKFLSLSLFAFGLLASATAHARVDRQRAGYGLTLVGFLGSWTAGYGLLKLSGASMGAPWVSASLLGSMVALGAAAAAGSSATRSRGLAALTWGALAASTTPMVVRSDAGAMGAATAVTVVLFAVLGAWWARGEGTVEDGTSGTLTWFGWIARLEGVSLLALFGVYMPAKYLAHVELDGGQGWFGWMHGQLFLAYLVALVVTGREAGWSLGRMAVGFVASLLPGGTFWFERRVGA